jgi:hypothetical protein
MKRAEYFVQRGSDVRGPTTPARIRELAAAGKLSRDDLIRRGDNGDWFRVGDIPNLFDGAPGDPDEELLTDPLANMAGQAAGLLKRAAGAVGKAGGQVGTVVKGAIAKRAERRESAAIARRETEREAEEFAAAMVPTKPPDFPRPQIARARFADDTTTCPYCSERIKREAKKCKHCGEILDPALRESRLPASAAPTVVNVTNVVRQERWNRGVAILLSLLIPGLGQLYKGQILSGIFWFFLVMLGYIFIIPGLVLHFCCICGAAMGDPYR